MNLKTLIILISSAVLAALAAFVFVYYIDTAEPESEKNTSPNLEEELIEEYKETFIVRDDFKLTLPPGWQEAEVPEDFSFMAADFREVIIDEKMIEADFRTNFSIKKDDLTRYTEEYTPETYAESIKVSLVQTIPGIEFINEEQAVINGRQAYFIECESITDEIDYKTLLVFIKIDDNIMWVVSFNTFSNSWQNYRDQFYQIAQSFK